MDRHACRHHAAGRVDVHVNVFFRIFRFQEQKLSHNERGHLVLDRSRHEHDPFAQQTRKNVEAPLSAVRLLNDDGNKRAQWIGNSVVHETLSSLYRGAAPTSGEMRAASRGLLACRPLDRKSTRLTSSHYCAYRMPSSASKNKI